MRIAKSADWRRRLISKFPDDARIIAAAERLERLSHTPEDEIDVEFWVKLKPYLDT
jgi:hypothetical protein